MQGSLLDIFFILLLIVIDFCLQKKINKKGYVYLCINKGRLRYPILVFFVASFIYFVLKKTVSIDSIYSMYFKNNR